MKIVAEASFSGIAGESGGGRLETERPGGGLALTVFIH
jgi:hypothetical protein